MLAISFDYLKKTLLYKGLFVCFITYCVLPASLHMHHIHNWCPWRPKELAGSNGAGVTVRCEPTNGCCGQVLGARVLYQRGKCSLLLSELSSPLI